MLGPHRAGAACLFVDSLTRPLAPGPRLYAQAAYPSLFGFSVSHTTRAPRPGEVDGTHYHFTTSDAFLAAVDQGTLRLCRSRSCACTSRLPDALPAPGLFLEHAHVHGNLYGTTLAAIAAVRDAGKVCILDLDVQGAESVKSARLGAKFLFVAPPSMDELERRLRGRGTETEEKVRPVAGSRDRHQGRD